MQLYVATSNVHKSIKPASMMERWRVLREFCAAEERPEYCQQACEWLVDELPSSFCNCLMIPHLAQVLDEVLATPAFAGMLDTRVFKTIGRFDQALVSVPSYPKHSL